MENSITNALFKGREVRIVVINDEPWFIAKDVAEILGYEAPRNAIATHVDDEDKLTHRISASGQNREMVIINESGLYSLILSSKLPSAKEFKRWITSEVLPAIRKHGVYATEATIDKMIEDPDLAIRLFQQLKQERVEKARIAAEAEAAKALNLKNEPKVVFADAVACSHTDILVGDLAKILRGNGIDIGQKRLFGWLRDKKYLISQKGLSWNMPTQWAMERGLFRVKETAVTHSDGTVTISRTTKVTGKGQQHIVNQFLGAIAPNPEYSLTVATLTVDDIH